MKNRHSAALGRVVAAATFVLACLASQIASAQPVSIASDAFPGVFLRLDGRLVTSFLPNGGGVVNGQFGTFAWEKFCVRQNANGTVSFESVAFPRVFLHLDGRGITGFLSAGGGIVNAQLGAFAWEQFWPRQQLGLNKFTFESVAFPNVFLRLDGRLVTSFLPNGGGTANAQFAAYGWEHFTRVTSTAGGC